MAFSIAPLLKIDTVGSELSAALHEYINGDTLSRASDHEYINGDTLSRASDNSSGKPR